MACIKAQRFPKYDNLAYLRTTPCFRKLFQLLQKVELPRSFKVVRNLSDPVPKRLTDRGDRAWEGGSHVAPSPLWVPYLPTTSQAETFQTLSFFPGPTKPKQHINHYKNGMLSNPHIMDFIHWRLTGRSGNHRSLY